jgi:hypothetical protein
LLDATSNVRPSVVDTHVSLGVAARDRVVASHDPPAIAEPHEERRRARHPEVHRRGADASHRPKESDSPRVRPAVVVALLRHRQIRAPLELVEPLRRAEGAVEAEMRQPE